MRIPVLHTRATRIDPWRSLFYRYLVSYLSDRTWLRLFLGDPGARGDPLIIRILGLLS